MFPCWLGKCWKNNFQEIHMGRPKNVSKPTLEDIAARSGVSLATVSRVVNQSRPVSEDLERRVKHAIEELGFEPKCPKLQTVAIVVPQILNPFLTAVVTGAQEEAMNVGLHSVILNVTKEPEWQRYHLQLLDHFPFDGLVVLHTMSAKDIIVNFATRKRSPVVVIGRMIDSPHLYCISADRENAMYKVAKYLISLNHREIAYISGRPDLEVSKSRLRGIERAFSEAGLSLKPHLHQCAESTIEGGFQAASSLLKQKRGKRPSAIMGFNDLIAIGALHAVRTVGLSVPEDISVTGFDDISLSLHTSPPLTTVAQPKSRMGHMAMQKIFHLLQGNDLEGERFTPLECPLIVRESTAPCQQKNR
jgi:DNA-binding LacI/PurR family transcriptional regulator